MGSNAAQENLRGHCGQQSTPYPSQEAAYRVATEKAQRKCANGHHVSDANRPSLRMPRFAIGNEPNAETESRRRGSRATGTDAPGT